MSVPTIQQKVRFLFWTLAHIVIFTVILSWVFYPEHYGFFSEFISNLGGVTSETGISNQVSSIIFIVGFGCSAVLALTIGIIYFVSDELRNKPNYIRGFSYVKGTLCLVVMIGAAFIAIPHDYASGFLTVTH